MFGSVILNESCVCTVRRAVPTRRTVHTHTRTRTHTTLWCRRMVFVCNITFMLSVMNCVDPKGLVMSSVAQLGHRNCVCCSRSGHQLYARISSVFAVKVSLQISINCSRFEVLRAVLLNVQFFWDVTPCQMMKIYRSFEGYWSLHRHCQ